MVDVTTASSVSDIYVERLRKKYLQKPDETTRISSRGTLEMSEAETFAPLPANPSLTETERKHYNRAMKEFGKALKFSEDNLKVSGGNFEESMQKSPNEANFSDQTLNEPRKSDSDDADGPSILHKGEDPGDSEAATWVRSLPAGNSTRPSTIIVASQDTRPRRAATFASSEDLALSWDDGSSNLTGLSCHLYSNFNSENPISMPDIKAIHSELFSIYQKLQNEKGRIAEQQILEEKLEANFDTQARELAIGEAFLLEKERELLERERALALGLQNLKKTKEITAKLEGVELEVQDRINFMQQNHQLEIEQVNATLLAKVRELKRLKYSFDMVKEQNDDLRTKLADAVSACKKATTQSDKLKKRLENLQRRQDFRTCKPQNLKIFNREKENFEKHPMVASSKCSEKTVKTLSGILEALCVTFDWVTESSLKKSELKLNEKTLASSDEFITDKCLKILPLLVDVIRILPAQSSQKKNQLSFLSFIQLCLCRIDDSQHSLLSSTTRRLGEEIYKPSLAPAGIQKNSSASLILATTASSAAIDSVGNLTESNRGGEGRSYSSAFFRSSNQEIRLLSCFIILNTLHQVDILAHVFGQMKRDLKDETSRQLFLSYDASHIVLPYITYRANKALSGDAIDVLLQMSMESPLLPAFLEQCSKEEWFRAFASALRGPSSDTSSFNVSSLEKLSIILQKLSKIKANRKFFDAFSIGRNLQECYRCCDPKNTFLTLNLRSILFNLNLLKNSSQTPE